MTRQLVFMFVGGSLALLSAGCQRSETEDALPQISTAVLEVNVVPVEKQPIEASIELTGTLYPWKFATIASEVTGVIERVAESGESLDYELDGQSYHRVLPLDIGHRVKQGDVLAVIDSSEQRHALQLSQAKKLLAEKELVNLLAWRRPEEVTQLKAQCEECEAVLVDAEADLQRAQTLVARKATSTKEVEDAERSVATALAGKKRAEAALKLAEAGPTAEQIEVAKAQLELATSDVSLKQEMVDKCTIRCPLEQAWIVERYVGTGDHVTANPSTPLLRLVDSSVLLAQINVPERYQGLIRVEDRATVTAEGVQSADGDVAAMIVLVNAQIDPDTRTFRVRVGIDNSQNLFKAGTFVRVKIPLRSVSDAVVVPLETVTFTDGEPATFVVRDGVVDRVPVKLGIANRTHYQIVSGLSPSDQVVCGDLSLLAPGLHVKPRSRVETPANTPAPSSSSATPAQG